MLDRVKAGYAPTRRQALQEELARYCQQPDGNPQVQRLLDRYLEGRAPSRCGWHS